MHIIDKRNNIIESKRVNESNRKGLINCRQQQKSISCKEKQKGKQTSLKRRLSHTIDKKNGQFSVFDGKICQTLRNRRILNGPIRL